MIFLPLHFLSVNSHAEHMIDCSEITHFNTALRGRISARHVFLSATFTSAPEEYVIAICEWCGVVSNVKYIFSH
jgi:hypothetical protein